MDKPPSHLPRLLAYIHLGDLATFNWCMKRKRQQLLTACSRVVSRSADGFYYPLLPLLAWAFDPALARSLFVALALAFCLERPLYQILKKACKRNRPAEALPDFSSYITPSDKFSFPSGHTSAAFLTATVLIYFLPGLFWPAYIWACLVGASRILLGVHFPTDTLAGALIGSTIATLTLGYIA